MAQTLLVCSAGVILSMPKHSCKGLTAPTIMLNHRRVTIPCHWYVFAACECAVPYLSMRDLCMAEIPAICAVQGQQGASLQLTARLQEEIASFKPTLAINNGDIAYARRAPATPVMVSIHEI